MNATTHPAVRDYLRAVERALDGLPRERRDEIVAELREHVDAALSESGAGAESDDARIRTVLDRLGSPADIAAEARERFGAKRPRHVLENVALVLVTAGSLLLPFVGWLVGIVLVYTSPVWERRHRVMATLLFPFGFLPALYVLVLAGGGIEKDCFSVNGGPQTCAAPHHTSVWTYLLAVTVFLLSAVGPIITAVVLGRRLARRDA